MDQRVAATIASMLGPAGERDFILSGCAALRTPECARFCAFLSAGRSLEERGLVR